MFICWTSVVGDNVSTFHTWESTFLISAPIWESLTLSLSGCLSVTLLEIASFLFLGGIKPFFGHQLSMLHSTKCCSSIFDLGPLMPKIYSPKFSMAHVWWQLGQSVHTKTCMWGSRLPACLYVCFGVLFVCVLCWKCWLDNRKDVQSKKSAEQISERLLRPVAWHVA